MVIGVDGNDANVTQKVGVSVYTHSLLSYFQKHADDLTSFKVYLRDLPNNQMPAETSHYKYVVVKGPVLWSQLFLPLKLLTSGKTDVFFSPAHYTPRYTSSKVVVTVHDLAFFYYPQEFLKKDLYKLTNWTRRAVRQAKKVIAVSQNTKKDLIKFYNLPENKIEVVHNGFEKKVDRETGWDTLAKKYNIAKEKYILYVGTLQPRKNVQVLVEAFEKFHKENPTMKLMLVGKRGWLYEDIFNKVRVSSLKNSIVFTDYLPDEDVVTLYRHAYCYVLPSLYEGFGVPILEAMSYDCPVISSFTSSLVEVGGEAAIYFDPEKPHGLVEDLESLKSKKVRSAIIKKGKEHVKKFSWETCGRETLQILKNA